jgi:hypothetical protein
MILRKEIVYENPTMPDARECFFFENANIHEHLKALMPASARQC